MTSSPTLLSLCLVVPCMVFAQEPAAGLGAGTTCTVRPLTQMHSAYPSGLISLTQGQMMGFSNNWRSGGLKEKFDEEGQFAPGKRLVSSLESQYASYPNVGNLLSVHLSLAARQVWVLTSDNRSGNMVPVPIDGSVVFDAAAMFIDRFLCTTIVNDRALSAAIGGGDLQSAFLAMERVQANPYVSPGVGAEAAVKYFQRFNRADPNELERFKVQSPKNFEKAVRNSAFMNAGLKNVRIGAASDGAGIVQTPQDKAQTILDALSKSGSLTSADLAQKQVLIRDLSKNSLERAEVDNSPKALGEIRTLGLENPNLKLDKFQSLPRK